MDGSGFVIFDLIRTPRLDATLGSNVAVFRLISPAIIVCYCREHQQNAARLLGPALNALQCGNNVVFHCVQGQVRSAVLRWQTWDPEALLRKVFLNIGSSGHFVPPRFLNLWKP